MAKQEEVTFVAVPQPGIGIYRKIRVFLWDTDGIPTPMYPKGTPLPNTKWADFSGEQLYRTSDPRAINKLRNSPDYGRNKKFYEVDTVKRPDPIFSCPKCDYTKEGKEGWKGVIMHARVTHKIGLKREELAPA